MILYHGSHNLAIHIPSRCGRLSLHTALSPEGFAPFTDCPYPPEKEYLVVRHPIDRAVSCYKAFSKGQDFKVWLTGYAPKRAVTYCPHPTAVLRLEEIEHDLKMELCIKADVPHLNKSRIREIVPCATSRILIRRHYNEDFSLGDYE